MIPGEAARAANHARFARLVARPEPDIDLALGALMIAAEDRPDLEFDPTLAALDVLADRVRLRLDRGDSTDLEIERLHDVLYREWGFRPPNAAEYHATGNSQLDRVIERRIGLPITLSIVELLEVIEPTDPEHPRDRGLLLGRMGRFTEAIGLLRRYLDERPDGTDAADVKQVIGIFRGRRN